MSTNVSLIISCVNMSQSGECMCGIKSVAWDVW